MNTTKPPKLKLNSSIKRLFRLLAVGLLVAGTILPARALVLPVLEDTATSSSAANAAGKVTSLKASTNSTALIRFGVGNFTNIAPKNVTQARLTLYLSSVLKPGSGNLRVLRVTSDWHESAGSGPVAPNVGEVIADLGTPTARYSKQFLICDVTSVVTNWLANPASDFGFA